MLDLFSGIGGFSLAASWTNQIDTVAFCEIEDFPQKVLHKHWPHVPIFNDVRTLTKENLHEKGINKVDIITGGFPCQDLSSAGQQRGIYGERSGLWGELYRIMCDIRPKYTIFENVTGLLSGDDGRWFQRLLSDLAEGGFILEWECLPASSFGAPHHRDRVYGIAYPRENGWLRIFSQANIKSCRNVGIHQRTDWFGCGEGAWSNWQTETKREVFNQPSIIGKNDGVSRWMDRNSSLGNSIVPQVAYPIFMSILNKENSLDKAAGR